MNTEFLSNLTYYAIAGGITLLVLAGLFILAWKLFHFFKAKSNEAADAHQEQAAQTVKNLAVLLAEAEKDSNKASLVLLDAQTHTQTLVNLVQGIALKAETMAAEIDTLNAALEAISSRDPLQIATAAGKLHDQHIRTLMLGRIKNLEYWQDTSHLIAAQVGTLAQWEKGYRVFSSNLLSEIAKTKAQLAALDAALELTGTSRPLLQAQANLTEATHFLQLERRPGLYQMTKQLPAINAGLAVR